MDIERAIAIAATPVIISIWSLVKGWGTTKLTPLLKARFTHVSVREPLRLTHDKRDSGEAS